MKTLIAAISFSLLSIGAFAQTTTTTSKTKAPVKKSATPAPTYKCPVCGATSDKAGECSKDKVAFVKVGDYYCPDCYMTANKPGKCSMCGVDMKKMEGGTTAKK